MVLSISPSLKALITPLKAPIPTPSLAPSGGGGTKVVDAQARNSSSLEYIAQ